MPGVGDFNLRSFFRAMGIKNPQPSMREFVQPVILAGDMSEIVPQYRPPSAVFGGDIAAVVGEHSFFQLTSRAAGGTLVHGFGGDIILHFQTINPALANTLNADFPLAVQSSVEPPVSLVGTGSITPFPTSGSLMPSTSVTDIFPNTGGRNKPLWIRPGDSLFVGHFGVNAAVNQWYLWITDIPASENSIL